MFPSIDHRAQEAKLYVHTDSKIVDGKSCWGSMPTAAGLATMLDVGVTPEVLELANALSSWQAQTTDTSEGGERLATFVGTIDVRGDPYGVYTTVSLANPGQFDHTTVGRDPATLSLQVAEV